MEIGNILNVSVIKGNENSMLGAPKSVKLDISKYINEFGNYKFMDYKQSLRNTCGWYNEENIS